MLPMLLAVTAAPVKSQGWFRAEEVGLIIGILGALVLGIVGFLMNGVSDKSRFQRAVAMSTGAGLLGIGFVLQILGLHFAG